MAATRSSSLPKSFLNFLTNGVANEGVFHPPTLRQFANGSSHWALQAKRPLPHRNRGHNCTLGTSHRFVSNVCHSIRSDLGVLRSLHSQVRWKHAESSTASSPSATSKTEQTNDKGRRPSSENCNAKRRKANFSPLYQITANHPKNSTSPLTHATLTRKQLLRLTPKQRATLKLQRIQHRKQSMSYLDTARANVRSNLKYLKGTAESNLKKNIHTIQRLFRGEHVWKEDEPTVASRTSTIASSENNDTLQWDRLPHAIQTQIQTNLATLQNWLHKTTDGMIPSYSSSSSKNAAEAGDSIAIRLQKFHDAKQHQELVMDNKWIAWNIALALLPGLMVHLFCLSKQEEMQEFYAMLQEREREKILGVRAEAAGGGERVDGREGTMDSRDAGDRNGMVGGMGLSSALISEGGSTWDKITMAVNDLFLGGVDEKVKMAKGAAAPVNLNVEKTVSHGALASDKSSPENAAPDPALFDQSTVSVSDANGTISTNAKDVTMEALLRRIQELEARVRMSSDKETNLSPEDQRRPSHKVQYQVDRIKQSPMQNRRDDSIVAQWRTEEEEKKQEEGKRSDSFDGQTVVGVLLRWIHVDSSAATEWINEKMSELGDKLSRVRHDINEVLSTQVIPDSETSKSSGNLAIVSDDENQLGKPTVQDPPIDNTSDIAPAGNSTDILSGSDVLAIEKTDGRFGKLWSKLSWRRHKKSDHVDGQSPDTDESIK